MWEQLSCVSRMTIFYLRTEILCVVIITEHIRTITYLVCENRYLVCDNSYLLCAKVFLFAWEQLSCVCENSYLVCMKRFWVFDPVCVKDYIGCDNIYLEFENSYLVFNLGYSVLSIISPNSSYVVLCCDNLLLPC